MDRVRRAWDWFGERPALAVVVTFYGAAVVVVRTTGDGAGEVVAQVALFAVLALHIAARRERRWEVLGLVWLPAPVLGIVGSFTDPPRWLALTLIAVAILFAWGSDLDEKKARAAPGLEPAQ